MVIAGSDGKTIIGSSVPDTSGPEINWEEEGRKAFIEGKIRPGLPKNYPTQDTHTPANEHAYLKGYKMQQDEWLAGNGFAGLAAYAKELEESKDS